MVYCVFFLQIFKFFLIFFIWIVVFEFNLCCIPIKWMLFITANNIIFNIFTCNSNMLVRAFVIFMMNKLRRKRLYAVTSKSKTELKYEIPVWGVWYKAWLVHRSMQWLLYGGKKVHILMKNYDRLCCILSWIHFVNSFFCEFLCTM